MSESQILSEAELEMLKNVCAAATEPPWEIPVANLGRVIATKRGVGIVENADTQFMYGQSDLSYERAFGKDWGVNEHADRRFISAARSALPSLVAEVDIYRRYFKLDRDSLFSSDMKPFIANKCKQLLWDGDLAAADELLKKAGY